MKVDRIVDEHIRICEVLKCFSWFDLIFIFKENT